MGPIWGRQDPGGPHVGPMNFALWEATSCDFSMKWMGFPRRKTPSHDVTTFDPNGWPGYPLRHHIVVFDHIEFEENPTYFVVRCLPMTVIRHCTTELPENGHVAILWFDGKIPEYVIEPETSRKPSLLSFHDEMGKHLLEWLIVSTVPLENKNRIIQNRIQ